MVNDTNNSKLDQAVKQTLSNYEAPYNATDWATMESMLDAAPKSRNFKWSYSLNILIGVAILGGIYLIYNSISSSSENNSTINTEVQQPAENPVNTTGIAGDPVLIPVPPATSTPTENIPFPKELAPLGTTLVKDEASVKKESEIVETGNKKTGNATGTDEKVPRKPQLILKRGNEPIFGDMLDSSKGIVGKTKEKEETKNAVKAQPDNSIGWNSFFLRANLDSLKRYHEQQQKDSLKK